MKTLKLRIKDKHSKVLDQLASEVNFVWNYVNDLSFKHLKRTGDFFSAYDMAKYTKGASKLCGLHSQTIQAVTEELVTRRKQFKKAKLKWRVSNKKSARRSLGWIPFKKDAIKYADGYVQYGKHQFKLWDSYGLSKYSVRTGSFVEDSRGRWYVCLVVDSPKQDRPTATKAIGIDLGLKDVATCSDGTVISNPKFYRKYEQKLGIAQRARNKKRVRALHAKIANCRKDHLHKASTMLVKNNAMIVIGNLSAAKLVKTKMAKSVLDTGFSALKTMLEYKCENAGVLFEEVNEAYTTRTCNFCRGDTGPRGINGLGIREWECVDCGTIHDRDVNAALNILALGHERLAGGIPLLKQGEDVKAIEESERKDKVIAHQEGVIDLQTAVAEAKHEVEVKYESRISKLYADIRSANATIGGLSQTNNQARNYVTTSTDCPSISEYTTTYIDLYEELGQFAEGTSVEADRATAEAVRQHEASRVQVEEYNKFIKEQKGEL